jgi:hypothetical protein
MSKIVFLCLNTIPKNVYGGMEVNYAFLNSDVDANK